MDFRGSLCIFSDSTFMASIKTGLRFIASSRLFFYVSLNLRRTPGSGVVIVVDGGVRDLFVLGPPILVDLGRWFMGTIFHLCLWVLRL